MSKLPNQGPSSTNTSHRPANSVGVPPNDALSAGLSTGAQAGIGVGTGVIGIAIGSLLMWLIIRKRTRNHDRRSPEHIESADAKYGSESPPHPDIPELSGEEVSKLTGKRTPDSMIATTTSKIQTLADTYCTRVLRETFRPALLSSYEVFADSFTFVFVGSSRNSNEREISRDVRRGC